jgi:hypothetical protein
MSVSENNENIIRVRKIRWAELVARTGRRKLRGFETETERKGTACKTGVDGG